MYSFTFDASDCKDYLERIGPELERPERPKVCPFCDYTWVWFDGWRILYPVILTEGKASHLRNGLFLQRVACSKCYRSWTLYPAFLYPYRVFEPDHLETAALLYLSAPDATYKKVSQGMNCSARSIWRWVGWTGMLLSAAELVAKAELLDGSGQGADVIPRSVPQDHKKAYSEEREVLLLKSYQGLSSLVVFARAQPIPPADPSPLRFWLIEEFQQFRKIHYLTRHRSPPLPVVPRGPPV